MNVYFLRGNLYSSENKTQLANTKKKTTTSSMYLRRCVDEEYLQLYLSVFVFLETTQHNRLNSIDESVSQLVTRITFVDSKQLLSNIQKISCKTTQIETVNGYNWILQLFLRILLSHFWTHYFRSLLWHLNTSSVCQMNIHRLIAYKSSFIAYFIFIHTQHRNSRHQIVSASSFLKIFILKSYKIAFLYWIFEFKYWWRERMNFKYVKKIEFQINIILFENQHYGEIINMIKRNNASL